MDIIDIVNDALHELQTVECPHCEGTGDEWHICGHCNGQGCAKCSHGEVLETCEACSGNGETT